MNAIGGSFFAAAAVLTLMLPRRWAVLPLLASVLYMTDGQLLVIADANFNVPRCLIAVGFLRVLLRRERIEGGLRPIDHVVLLWAALLLGTSAFHTSDAWLYRSGLVWTELGSYLLFRILICDLREAVGMCKAVALMAVPLAALMLQEKSSGSNVFGALLGGASPFAAVREGSIRASGPFAHAILAGTFGTACTAIGLALWQRARAHAVAGIAAGLTIVYACASSGPLLMLLFVVLAMLLWRMRHHMRSVRMVGLTTILLLAAVMKAPVYFLMARIDVIGGSQGWYRAQLIDSAIEHLSEWWLVGTDYTRHWMATGLAASDRHTDLTNHFLVMGVFGGLPLLLVFVLVFTRAFRGVGELLRQPDAESQHFFVWALGALLFGFMVSFLSISLFDQSVIMFWMLVAMLATVCAAAAAPRNNAFIVPTARAVLS